MSLNTAIEFFYQKDYEKAQNLLEQELKHNPKNAEGHYYLGLILHQKDSHSKAMIHFQKALEYDPTHTNAAIALSVLYNDLGLYQEGAKIFNQAQKKIKSSPTLSEKAASSPNILSNDPHLNKKFSGKHLELADLYLTYNRFDEALLELKKVLELDSQNLEAALKMAKVTAKKGLYALALEQLKKLKSEHPKNIEIRQALGLVYFSKGNSVAAKEEWSNALGLDPSNKKTRSYLTWSSSANETTLEF